MKDSVLFRKKIWGKIMKKFKAGYYTADTVNGVQYNNDWGIDYPDAKELFPLEFLDELPYVQEGQIIVTSLESYHKKIFIEIEENYGVNQ